MNVLIQLLNRIVMTHAITRVNRKVASERTVTVMGDTLRACFRLLLSMGFRLEKPENLSEKHIEALCKEWHRLGRAPKTMQGNLSVLRIFCGWIGKKNMVKDIFHYLKDVPREELRATTVADRSKSWTANGIDLSEKIRHADSLDWRFGLMLRLQVAFGLRRMEVLQCIPWKNDEGDKFPVYKTKGGRPRIVYIDNDEQRKVLDTVKARLKKNEYLGWNTRRDGKAADLAYTMRLYSRLLPQIGITKKDALVSGHGLRAQYAENAALIASLIPVTLGGTIGQMERDELNLRRAKVSELLGHSRVGVTTAYYGSFGRAGETDSPDRARNAIQAGIEKIPPAKIKDVPQCRLNDCLLLTAELMSVKAFVDPRSIQALWEHHSSRHNTDWLSLGVQNIAALEAAANHFASVA